MSAAQRRGTMEVFKMGRKRKAEALYINITPTWRGLYPAMERVLIYGTPAAREEIRAEFLRLCDAVDAMNAEAQKRRSKK